MLILASLMWVMGSFYIRKAKLPSSAPIAMGAQMLIAFFFFAIASVASGEPNRFSISSVQFDSIIALAYLVLFGSIVAFTAYQFLLKNTSPTIVSTYSFINPTVALYLGWLIADEILTLRTIVSSGIVIAGVIIIIGGKARARKQR
jgi:drug/metabolite transporter (DMT)-like permease